MIENQINRKPPEFLYRYRPISEYSLSEIRDNTVFMSPYELLNDPEDMQFEIENMELESIRQIFLGKSIQENNEFQSDIKNLDLKELKDIRDKVYNVLNEYTNTSQDYGVVCFSETADNEHMWKEYAGNSTGIAIEYDLRSTPIPKGALLKVIYTDEIVKISPREIILDMNGEGKFYYKLRYKTIKWEVENEWRIIMNQNRINVPIFPIRRVICGKDMDSISKTKVKNAILDNGKAIFAEMIYQNDELKIHQSSKLY